MHVLFIPKNEIIPTLDDLQPSQAHLIGKLALAAAEYARREGFAQDGYRIVMNCREHAGQTVFHIHMHLLAVRRWGISVRLGVEAPVHAMRG